MNLCNYNLNATILGLFLIRKIYRIRISSLFNTEKYVSKGFTISDNIEYTVWFKRKIRERNFKYISILIFKNSPGNGITFYSFLMNRDRRIKIGFWKNDF